MAAIAAMEAYMKNKEENNIINEEQLDAVSGGASQNRYDPARCNPERSWRTTYECVGFLSSVYCDHYTRTYLDRVNRYWHKCAMGCFDYEGTNDGQPY